MQEQAVVAAEKSIEAIKARKKPNMNIDTIVSDLSKYEEEERTVLDSKNVKKVQLERIQWWLDVGFGAKGLKAYIFSAMLSKLNSYVVKYAELLGVRVKFSVDMEKASKPFLTTCYFEGEDVPYETLSGGEKQRVDVAVAFAMHDLVSHAANINVLFMDEVFEGLDSEGVEAVYELVRTKAGEGKSVYIITHASELDSSFTKRFTVVYDKEKNTTVLK